ncbi:TerB family tellurite resistance protein [uncultured Dokdonia sp.]|uniref:tellurite resistance TerB family protein n=1 Tax=uncultured Dokdonia sp. TaxID=575653 RepID=UPI00262DCBB3|nr:TerB family tellurite resistance protein [uncultured Dokdonia sp.]
MSISDLYDSGFRKRNEDHFAAMVRIAMSDAIITEDEKKFLDRTARNLDISEEDYKAILKDYMSHSVNPPISYENRLERLFDLGRMVYSDHELGEKQTVMLERLAVGLGFTATNVKYIVDKALSLVNEGVDLDTFKEEIKLMNR